PREESRRRRRARCCDHLRGSARGALRDRCLRYGSHLRTTSGRARVRATAAADPGRGEGSRAGAYPAGRADNVEAGGGEVVTGARTGRTTARGRRVASPV